MKTLYFRGKSFYVSNLGSASYIVRVPDRPLTSLTRADLRFLAMKKYGWKVCRAPGVEISDGLISFMRSLDRSYMVTPLPADFEEKHRALDATRTERWTATPRRIPHVRMVRAAALQPGMEILGHATNGRVSIKFEVLNVVPVAQGISVEAVKLERRMDDGTHKAWGARRHDIFLQADQVVPVFVEWRDKVAL